MSLAFTEPLRRTLLRPSNKFLYSALSLLVLLFFVASLMQPYVTDDALIYALIGKGIYAKGLLPFSFAFDHKPIFTYYIYGLVALLSSDDFPKYQVLSVIGYAASAFLTARIAGKEKWWLHFLVISGLSIHFLRFSGNTELFFSPIAIFSVYLLLQRQSYSAALFSGLLASMAFNINYLALFSFGPAALYAIWSGPAPSGRKAALTAVATMSFVAGFLLILSPLAFSHTTSIPEYFQAQGRFYHGYAGQEIGRTLWKFVIGALPMLVLLALCLPCEEKDRRKRNAIFLVALFAALAAFISKKNFTYYWYPVVLPTVIIWAMSSYRNKHGVALISVLTIALLTAPSIIYQYKLVNVASSYDFDKYRELKETTGSEKVLLIRAHNSIPLFSDIELATPLVWPNHAQLFYGPDEDVYFLEQLKSGVKFVLMRPDACVRLPLVQSCAYVRRHFDKGMTFDTGDPYQKADLYRLKAPGSPG